jgi:hypothetical protein
MIVTDAAPGCGVLQFYLLRHHHGTKLCRESLGEIAVGEVGGPVRPPIRVILLASFTANAKIAPAP